MGSALTPRGNKHSATEGTDASKTFSKCKESKGKVHFQAERQWSPESWTPEVLVAQVLPLHQVICSSAREGTLCKPPTPLLHCSEFVPGVLRLWSLGMSVKTDLLSVCKYREEPMLFCEVASFYLVSLEPSSQTNRKQQHANPSTAVPTRRQEREALPLS